MQAVRSRQQLGECQGGGEWCGPFGARCLQVPTGLAPDTETQTQTEMSWLARWGWLVSRQSQTDLRNCFIMLRMRVIALVETVSALSAQKCNGRCLVWFRRRTFWEMSVLLVGSNTKTGVQGFPSLCIMKIHVKLACKTCIQGVKAKRPNLVK